MGAFDVAKSTAVHNQLIVLLKEKFHLEILSMETDLLDSGVIDSLRFVELAVMLEEEFGVTISPKDLEIDYFRSIERIADFVINHDKRKAIGDQ